jgi:prepilin-type N-terminal cleavage/methylation domain-containing protein
MRRSTREHPVTTVRRLTRRRLHGCDESGFTLIELIIVVAIMPIILGGIAVALLSVFSLQGPTGNRIGSSNDELVASSNFNKDVQSSAQITTNTTGYTATVAGCGSLSSKQSQLLGLEWGANSAITGKSTAGYGYQTVVSYVSSLVTNPVTNTSSYRLLRQVCTSGPSATPTSTFTVSSNLGSAPTVYVCGATSVTPTTNCGAFSDVTSQFSNPAPSTVQWAGSNGVTKVAFNVDEPGGARNSDYNYQLVGLPSQGISQGSSTTTTIPTTGNNCEFATPGTGTYANQLCFIDFTGFNNTTYSASNPNQCQQMSGQVKNTPYTINFCISVVPNSYSGCAGSYTPLPLTAFPIPTYYVTGQTWDSEAFLGNNGFYTGLTGNPALYQDQTNNVTRTHADPPNSSCEWQMSTIYITNFQVLDAAGQQASGWTLVAGDAESTDSGEWTVYQNLSSTNWSVLDNNGPSDPYGNSCYDSGDNNSSVPGDQTNVGFLGYKNSQPLAAGQTIPNADKVALPVSPATFPKTGTTAVLCESDSQLNKTGALMLAAQQTTAGSQSIEITMNGHGWGQAVFLGVLL